MQNQKRRREIWNRYGEGLYRLPWLSLPLDAPDDCKHGYFTYVVRILDKERDSLAQYLLEKGIYTTVRYSPLHHLPIFGHRGGDLVNTEKIYKESLCLPLHPGLKEEELSFIIDSIKTFGGIAA
jgi:aminotransferase